MIKTQKSFSNKKNSLYIIATPIGNLEDITFRAINILKEVDIIACEDKRVSGKLLNHYKIKKPLFVYNVINEKEASKKLLDMLFDDKRIALISSAGVPRISDPGSEIIKKAIENDFNVIPIPGASAFVSALSISEFDNSFFLFNGFFPKKENQKNIVVGKINQNNYINIFYESSHRIEKTINFLNKKIPNNKILLCKELTKIHESIFRGKVFEVKNYIKNIQLKGEYVFIIEPLKEETKKDFKLLIKEVDLLKKEKNISTKKAIESVSRENNLSKNILYKKYHS